MVRVRYAKCARCAPIAIGTKGSEPKIFWLSASLQILAGSVEYTTFIFDKGKFEDFKCERSFLASGQEEVLSNVVVCKSSGLYFRAAPNAEMKGILFDNKNFISAVLAVVSSMASITKSGFSDVIKSRLSEVSLCDMTVTLMSGFISKIRSLAIFCFGAVYCLVCGKYLAV